MATDDQPQRAYRAACPNCGAPVEFRSAASPMAVCSFCRSTLLRDGDALRRIGQAAELFDDHTPLQLGAGGRFQGMAFTLVGRVQMRYGEGAWNEWHALFDNGRSGWLSEDNGQYVFSFDAPCPGAVGELSMLRAGASLLVGPQMWSVASVAQAWIHSAEGELPTAVALPATGDASRPFCVVDLRNTRGEVATLDDRPLPAGAARMWSVGRSVALADLALSGLKSENTRDVQGQALACPSCGAALEPKLSTTKSIVCGQCHAVVDVASGVGGALAHYAQDNGSEPQIALGAIGRLSLGGPTLAWQVVGYVERVETGGSEDEWQSLWREYLLYHRTAGFAFLVDAEDGWSWTKPITGVPSQITGQRVVHEGVNYKQLYSYGGKITYVLGEFYWRLARDEHTANIDYQGTGGESRKRLNREQAGNEVVWSAGETLEAKTVAQAFRLSPDRLKSLQRDSHALSLSFGEGSEARRTWQGVIFTLVFIVFIIAAAKSCSEDECDEVRQTYGEASQEYQQCKRAGGSYRSSGGSYGGSYGGYSSGGGHK